MAFKATYASVLARAIVFWAVSFSWCGPHLFPVFGPLAAPIGLAWQREAVDYLPPGYLPGAVWLVYFWSPDVFEVNVFGP